MTFSKYINRKHKVKKEKNDFFLTVFHRIWGPEITINKKIK